MKTVLIFSNISGFVACVKSLHLTLGLIFHTKCVFLIKTGCNELRCKMNYIKVIQLGYFRCMQANSVHSDFHLNERM